MYPSQIIPLRLSSSNTQTVATVPEYLLGLSILRG